LGLAQNLLQFRDVMTLTEPRLSDCRNSVVGGASLPTDDPKGTKGCANAPRNPERPQGRAIADGIVEILAGLPAGEDVATGGPLFIDRAAGTD
jgi:hypothetical protein